MLEAAIVLQVALGEYVEAAIIAGLLVFNAVLGFFQEGRAQATLAALKSRLALTASVRRDGVWTNLPGRRVGAGRHREAVARRRGGGRRAPGRGIDSARSVHAHRRIHTHRSRPGLANLCRGAGAARRGGRGGDGDRNAHEVRTHRGAGSHRPCRQFAAEGRAARGAQSRHVQRRPHRHAGGVCLRAHAMPLAEIVPLVLTAILASIPVALPATFTLAAALGARALARQGVLPTRLSAVDEAATIDVLCADKTGTLTRNELTVTAVRPLPGFDEAHVLGLAALASSDGGQDPVDAAIRSAAARQGSLRSAETD